MKKIDGVIAKCDFNFNRKSSGIHFDVYFHKAKNKRLQMNISKLSYSKESLSALANICQKGKYAYADYIAKRMVYDPNNIRYVIHTFRVGDLTFVNE
ncbi:hypothetical protein ACJJID_13915 [Microbulbifer sp. CnH-101-G]|uniref:hypothetical protein n=1 Tax=Microbulbifer sp. CnH-101-G TaxID=3243393 RepID=UPI00403A197C